MRRSREVLNYRNVERFASYFNGNSKSITQLNEAYSKGNEGEILNIIKMNSAFKFIGNLMTIYNPLKKELARVILKKYGSSTYKSHITRFEPVKKSKKIKLVTYKRNKKTYKRAKKKRWTKR